MTEVLNEMTQTISKMTQVLGWKDWRSRSEERRWFGRLFGRDGGTRPLKRPAHLPVQISSGVSVA